MPLLKKKPFKRRDPPPGLQPDDEVFFCEATKEVFKDYESFFQRTILCNSLVWSCSVTGKSNLTYDEAVESEKKARKRLGDIPKPLKRGLLWIADHTSRGRIADLVDDVYVFSNVRYFVGEIVEGIINEQWCDCKVLKVIPPSQDEIDKDAAEEREEEEKASSPKKKPKKTFFPPDHLFKYELQEMDPDNPEDNPPRIIDAEDIRREKGTFTREKNTLFLKNLVELDDSGNLILQKSIRDKYKIQDLTFTDIFAGPEPIFEVTKRGKTGPQRKSQGTLDGWVSGSGSKNSSKGSSGGHKVKKQSAAEIEAEMRRMKEQNKRFKEEMAQRAEEAKKKRMEEKAKEKERKKEEKKLVAELLAEWKKPKEDLECEDLKELPKVHPVHCSVPNHLFGDFLSLLEFFHAFSAALETRDSFSGGITFKTLEQALADSNNVKGDFYEILRFMLQSLFDLQQEEDEEVKLEAKNLANVNVCDLDKNILGKDEDIANQIRSATQMARWCFKHQGQAIKNLHMDEYSITEILRLHLESSGAFRSEKSLLWLYQQRGGYKLSDDPGLQLRMEEPQILEALSTKLIYQLSLDEKLKILTCLMNQILSYATIRDEIDEKFNELQEAKYELRAHQINENKRQRQLDEAERAKKREERMQKKEEEIKEKENKKEAAAAAAAAPPDSEEPNLTDRQKEAIQAQKEKEEREKQKKEEIKKSEASFKERELMHRVAELQKKAGPQCLGRDRAYRRYWVLESIPGLFVEHDDDQVGCCLSEPTKLNPNAKPMDEALAVEKVKQILDDREKKSSEPNQGGSDKENDQDEKSTENMKTYSKIKKENQKVLSAMNGTLALKQEEGSPDEPATITETSANLADPETTSLKTETKEEPGMWGLCLADMDNCTVHSTILPKTNWSYIGTIEELDALIESLNPRGVREGELKDKLLSEHEVMSKNINKFLRDDFKSKFENDVRKSSADEDSDANTIVDLFLRDQILEIEERIFFGTLGTLKVRERTAWQNAIQQGSYDKQCDGLSWGGKTSVNTPFESRLVSASGSRDPSRPGSPDRDSNPRDSGSSFVKRQSEKVRGLACAILQVSQMLDHEKYLKPPLGEDEKERKKRLQKEEKRKKEAEEAAANDADCIVESTQEKILTPMQEWETSLMSCTSYAQLFVHLTTLDSSIIWAKSILNTKCRICRRKSDPDNMLLCDGCDRGHHLYCLKPKLKAIPEGDWFCHDCKPKERVKSPKKKSRKVFSNNDEEENDNDHQGQDQEEEETEDVENEDNSSDEEENNAEDNEANSDEDGDEENETPPRRTKKSKRSVDPPKKVAKNRKKESMESAPAKNDKKAKKGLSQLLGKRKSAAEASEKIAQVTKEEVAESADDSRQSSRLRNRNSRSNLMESATRLKEQRLSADNFSASSAAASKGSANRCKRRRGLDEELLNMFNPTALEDLLNNMMKHRDGWPFDRPITRSDAPDYFDIIKKPIDLGTVRTNLLHMKYSCNQEVLEDIKLVFENCYTYNKEEAEEYQCGVRLQKYYLKEAKKLGLVEESSKGSDSEEENQPLAKKSRRTL